MTLSADVRRTFPVWYAIAELLAKTLVRASALFAKPGRTEKAEELLPGIR